MGSRRKHKASWMKWLQQGPLGPSREWPRSLRYDMYGSVHLSNPRRFAVLLFMLGNGVEPIMAEAFLLENFVLDNSAKRQIKWILEHWVYKVRSNQWSYWIIAEGKSSNR